MISDRDLSTLCGSDSMIDRSSSFYWISCYQGGLQKRESIGSTKVPKAKEQLTGHLTRSLFER